jgi:HCOMODA/2-hydroxy-3-carboxy-muconic semialdehyde decarboxylase
MPHADSRLRDDLATATRILAAHDLIGMFGHVSVMTDNPERYLICPGAGKRKDRCRGTDVIELDLDYEFEPGLPLELYMHSEGHRAKPDSIRSLIHVHSPALTALSAIADVPGELLMIHAAFWPERMPIWDEPELVRDHDRAKRMIELLGEEALLLLRWHGAVIVGSTLKEAVFRAILAETHAKQLLAALSHGRPLEPVPSDIPRDELYTRMLPPFTHELHWLYASSFVPESPGA